MVKTRWLLRIFLKKNMNDLVSELDPVCKK